MRKKIAIVGVVILIIGIGLMVGGGYGISHTMIVKNNFTEYKQGMYVSEKLSFTKQTTVIFTNTVADSVLINASKISIVNQSNAQSFAIAPMYKVSNTITYKLPAGSYYFVIFTTTTPHTQYVYSSTQSMSMVTLYSMLAIIGIIMIVIGIIIAIVGVVLKPKHKMLNNTKVS